MGPEYEFSMSMVQVRTYVNMRKREDHTKLRKTEIYKTCDRDIYIYISEDGICSNHVHNKLYDEAYEGRSLKII